MHPGLVERTWTTLTVPRASLPGRSRPRHRPAPRRSRLGRTFRRVLLVLLLAPLLAYAALPMALRFVVPELLAAHGLPASVGSAHLDLWSLELTLSDLRVGAAGGPGITFAEARAGLVRDALAKGRIEIVDLHLRGASFDAAALGGARTSYPGLDVPFERAQLRDLRLADLSEKLGRDVVVRHARLHPDAALGRHGLAYEVDVDAGGAPLRIRGTLHEDGGAQTFEGTLRTSGLPVRLLAPTLPGRPAPWSGSVHAATEFELRYGGAGSPASLRASGSLRTVGAGAQLGGLAITQADSAWAGTLTLSGPELGAPERIYFKGTLDAARAQVAGAGGPPSATVSGLHWEGIGGWHGVPVAAGEGSIDSVEFVHAAPGAAPSRVRFDRVQLQATLDDAGQYRLEHLRARNVHAEPAGVETTLRLGNLEAREVRGVSGGVHIERVLAANLEALAGARANALRWTVERPVLDRVTVTGEGGAYAARAGVESVKVDGTRVGLTAFEARMQEVSLSPRGRIETGLASVETLESRGEDGTDVRVRGLHGGSLALDRGGAFEAGYLSVARIAGSRAGSESWAAQELAAKTLRFHSGTTEAGEAALGTLVYHAEDGDALESTGLHARSLALHPEGGGEAGSLGTESLHYSTAQGAGWEVRVLSLADAQWRADGSGSVSRAAADALRHRSAGGGERWQLDALELGPATLRAAGEVHIERVVAERTTLTLPSGERLVARGLQSGGAGRDSEGAAKLATLAIETLGYRAPSGLTWRAVPVEVEALARLAGGQVEARRLRSGALSLDDGEGGRWRAERLDAQRLEWKGTGRRLKADPLALDRLEYASGGGLAWRADTLLAGAFDWRLRRVPRVRHVSVAAFQGAADPGPAWLLSDLQATGEEVPGTEATRFRLLSAGAGHIESAPGDARLSWSGLRAADLRIDDAERVRTGRMVLGDTALRRGADPGASVAAARVEVGALVLDGRRLRAETVTLDHSDTVVGVNEEGEWMLPVWPGAAHGAGAWTVQVGELSTGGHNRLTLIDRSVEPPRESGVGPYRLVLTGLDSLAAEHAARFELEGTLAASARLRMSGELSAGRHGFDVRAGGRVSDFDLARLSDYAARHLDATIDAGQGDLEFDLELAGGEIDGVGTLMLRGLALGPAPSAGDAGGTGGASPAEALRRLAETGEAVELRVPVRGPIADPGFDFGNTAGRAIAQSVWSAPGPGGTLPSAEDTSQSDR